MPRYRIQWSFDHVRCRKELGKQRAEEILKKHLEEGFIRDAEKGGAKFHSHHMDPHTTASQRTTGFADVEVDENAQIQRPPPDVMRYMHYSVNNVFSPKEHRTMAEKHIAEVTE